LKEDEQLKYGGMRLKSLGIGLIGTGFMARTHSLAYTALPIYKWPLKILPEKIIVADIVEELAAESAVRLGYKRYTKNWEEVIDDPEVDIVDIVVPNDLHAEIAVAAAKAGKHVICEKPLARNAAEAEEMVSAVENAGVYNLVVYNYRRAPAVYEAKRLIDEGEVGQVFHFRGFYLQDFGIDPTLPLSWRFQSSRAGSGSLGDIGSHALDMALFLVGKVKAVTALTKTFIKERPIAMTAQDVLATRRDESAGGREKRPVDIDDVTVSLLEFENGATGSLEASRFARGHKNHLTFEVNGERGSVMFDWHHPAELQFYSSKDPDHTQGYRTILTGPLHPFGEMLWPIPGFGVGYPEVTILMMAEFFDCIAEGRKSTSDFRSGWENCKIMDAILKSAKSGTRMDVK
jgi:predicted dehydrogenase